MSDKWLHWQARLGSSKIPGLLIAFTAFIFLGMLRIDLQNSLGQLTGPQDAKIKQIIANEIGPDRYVRVSGTALYDASVKQIENGRVVALYYRLVDESTGDTLWVKSAQPKSDALRFKPQKTTAIGLTWSALSATRLTTVSKIYLDENRTPMPTWIAGVTVAGLGSIIFIGVATVFMPELVFVPEPIPAAAIFATGEPGARVSGHFGKVRHLEPWIEFGDATKNFRQALAELMRLENRHLLILVHFYPAATLDRRETTWGILVEPEKIIKVEPGKLYGWRDRWAVRLEYADEAVVRALVVSFNHAGAQSEFVERLKQMGYSISTPWTERV